MLTNIKKHPIQFGILFFLLFACVVMFFIFSYDRLMQRQVLYGATTVYLFWSLYYHYHRHDLHFSIIIEYVLFSLLALLVINSIIY